MNDRQRMVKKGLLKAVDIRVLCVADYTERIKKTKNIFTEYRRLIEDFHESEQYKERFYNHGRITHW